MLKGYIQVTKMGATAFIIFEHGVGTQADGTDLNDVVGQMRKVGTVALGRIDREAGIREFVIDFDKCDAEPISMDTLGHGLMEPVSAKSYINYNGQLAFYILADGNRHEVAPY